VHGLPPDWMGFLEDFHRHWPTDAPHTYVDFILNGPRGEGSARMGNPRWMRLTDQRCRAARSVFQFEGQGKVAAATHAGLPWILFLMRQLGERLHVWPFDGWSIPVGKSALVEVRPAIWRDLVPVAVLDARQKEAFVIALWLHGADGSGEFTDLFQPALSQPERLVCGVEGWIREAPSRS
jgi:hypothetical protein